MIIGTRYDVSSCRWARLVILRAR